MLNVVCLQLELIHTRHELLSAQKQVDSLTEKTREVSTFDVCCHCHVDKIVSVIQFTTRRRS